MRMLKIDEMRAMEPAVSPHLLGGAWCPIDGGVNPYKFTCAVVGAARRLGARICCAQEVRDIRMENGRIEEGVTGGMRIATHVVVNAAGIHVPRIAKMVGLHVPVNPERGQLTITEPMPKFMGRAVASYKQFDDGNFLIGVSNEYVGENTRVTTEVLSTRVRLAMKLIPPLKAARAVRCAAALRPMPPDGLPIYQKMDGVSDFYVAVGHSGITLAPVTGKIFSELITKGKTDIDLDEYRVERFKEKGEEVTVQH